MTKEIHMNHLGDTLTVLVDDEDYPLLSRHTWYIRSASVTNFYPATTLLVRDTGLRKLIAMHHMIMGVGLIDHINGNKLDNRKENLRHATYSQNGANTKKPRSNRGKIPTSKYKGVSRSRTEGKWIAQIGKDDARYCLGRFNDEKEAARAYNAKALELYGEFAKINEIEDD